MARSQVVQVRHFFFEQTPHVPPFLLQCLHAVQFLHAVQDPDPEHVAKDESSQHDGAAWLGTIARAAVPTISVTSMAEKNRRVIGITLMVNIKRSCARIG